MTAGGGHGLARVLGIIIPLIYGVIRDFDCFCEVTCKISLIVELFV